MLPLSLPPVPILARRVGLRFNIFFSTTLTPGVLNTANWFVRWMNLQRQIVTADAILPNRVRIQTGAMAANIGPNVVSYSPPPFDVVGPGGPAVAFADFPIT